MNKSQKFIALLVILATLSIAFSTYFASKASNCYNSLDSKYILKGDKQHDALINYIKWTYFLGQNKKEQAKESYDRATRLEGQIHSEIGLSIISKKKECRNYSDLFDISIKIALILLMFQLIFVVMKFKS